MGRRSGTKKKNKNKKSGKGVKAGAAGDTNPEPAASSAQNKSPSLCRTHECMEMNFYQWAFFLRLLMFACDDHNNTTRSLRSFNFIFDSLYLVDEHPTTISVGIGLATNIFLTSKPSDLMYRGVGWFAISYILNFVLMGTQLKKSAKQEPGSEAYMDWVGQCRMLARKVESPRDMILYLDRKLPCNCLEDLKELFLNLPDYHECEVCGKMCLGKDIYECSKCNVGQYCSRDCQLVHWPIHKHQCKLSRGKLTLADLTEYFETAPPNEWSLDGWARSRMKKSS